MAFRIDLKNIDVKKITTWFQAHITPMSAETLAFLAVVLIHSATIPTLLAVLTGSMLLGELGWGLWSLTGGSAAR